MFLQIGMQLDFVRNSVNAQDPYYKPFMPKGSKWDVVKTYAENWYKDEFFANELFNGCNPHIIQVVTHDKIREEFK